LEEDRHGQFFDCACLLLRQLVYFEKDVLRTVKKVIIIHYGEIAIKGENRTFFEKKLVKNIKNSIKSQDYEQIKRLRGRIVIYLTDLADKVVLEAQLKNVFGIAYFSFGVSVDRDIELIKKQAWQLVARREFDTFCIRTKRAQKDFPLNSVEISQEVGGFVFEQCQKKVDLNNPHVAIYIEITEKEALLFTHKIEGLRGLPVGVGERAISLLSSGIDSPVSSYLMLKRGVQLVYVHFHSYPYTSQASQENTERLVTTLCKLQYHSKVYFVPFIDIQKEIMAKAPAQYRVLLYRRYMIRIAEAIAEKERCRALVTGENVGQVASQTLTNIWSVGQVATLPILRPVAGFDKEEIIEVAKEIETFKLSTEPHGDCCSIFLPQNPATKSRLEDILKEEKKINMDKWVKDVVKKIETIII